MDRDTFARFERMVVQEPTTGCWLWAGCVSDNGYARLSIAHKPVYAHRLSYEHFVGEIPAGLEIDHLCRTRSCVNPAHLEPVTHVENVRRGAIPAIPYAMPAAKPKAKPSGRPAWSPEKLAAALCSIGISVTGHTLRNRIASGDLPARRDRHGYWRISDREVRARWPSLFFRLEFTDADRPRQAVRSARPPDAHAA